MLSIFDLKSLKKKRPISMVTCYDYPSALAVNRSEVDVVLVGDSLGEVVYGLPNTTHVTMDMMVGHVRAVKRGLKDKHLLVDMPIHSYDNPNQALKNAKILAESGADSLKLEIPSQVVTEAMVDKGFSIMGHVGLTPQTNQVYKKQGRDPIHAQRIFDQAVSLEKWGCFAILLEAVTSELASRITQAVRVPTIGIASGSETDGQVRVWMDLLDLLGESRPYVRSELHLFDEIIRALNRYHRKVIEKK